MRLDTSGGGRRRRVRRLRRTKRGIGASRYLGSVILVSLYEYL